MAFAPRGSRPVIKPSAPLLATIPRPPSCAKTESTSSPNAARVAFRDAVFRDAASAAPPVTNGGKSADSAGTTGAGRIVDHYTLTHHLHTSVATGTDVHAARHRLTGEIVVMKAMDRSQLAAAGRVPSAHTSALHARLEHEHIVRLHEVFDSQRLVHVLEWVPGITLDEFMQSHGCGPSEAQQIFTQLVSAVAYMHAQGVCHRDLRLNNVMLRAGRQCCVKLVDLGACGPADKMLTRRVPIVPVYAAPELLAPPSTGGRPATQPVPEYSGKAIDIWALGVILHVLLTGTFPFTSETAAREAAVKPSDNIPDELLKLMREMLTVDRTSFLSAADILAHPWLQPSPTPAPHIVASGSPAAWLRSTRGGSGAADGDTAAIHEEVLTELATLGMERTSVLASLEADARDEFTTAHYLVWQKHVRARNSPPLAESDEEESPSPERAAESAEPEPQSAELAADAATDEAAAGEAAADKPVADKAAADDAAAGEAAADKAADEAAADEAADAPTDGA